MAVEHHFGELADPVAQGGELRADVAENVEAVPVIGQVGGGLRNQAVAWRTVGGRGAPGDALGTGSGAVPADDLDTGMVPQPRGERAGGAVGQDLDRPAGGDVDEAVP